MGHPLGCAAREAAGDWKLLISMVTETK